MPSAPLKSAFKRRLIPLSESDDDLFDDNIKTPLSDIDEEVKIHNDDTEHDGEIIEVGETIEVGKNKREAPRIRYCFTYNNPISSCCASVNSCGLFGILFNSAFVSSIPSSSNF